MENFFVIKANIWRRDSLRESDDSLRMAASGEESAAC
jgi:hypothetical protein